MTSQMWFVVPAVLVLLYIIKTSGRNQRASQRGDSLVFGPSREITLTVFGAVVMGAALICGPVLQSGKIDMITATIGTIAIVSAFALLPPAVILSSDKLEVRWWWGKRTSLPWSLIDAASYDRAKRELFVYGEDGRVVKHTKYHVDGQRFRAEIARHVKRIDGLD